MSRSVSLDATGAIVLSVAAIASLVPGGSVPSGAVPNTRHVMVVGRRLCLSDVAPAAFPDVRLARYVPPSGDAFAALEPGAAETTGAARACDPHSRRPGVSSKMPRPVASER